MQNRYIENISIYLCLILELCEDPDFVDYPYELEEIIPPTTEQPPNIDSKKDKVEEDKDEL